MLAGVWAGVAAPARRRWAPCARHEAQRQGGAVGGAGDLHRPVARRAGRSRTAANTDQGVPSRVSHRTAFPPTRTMTWAPCATTHASAFGLASWRSAKTTSSGRTPPRQGLGSMGIGQGQRLPPPGTKVPLRVEPPSRPGAPRALNRTAIGEDQSEAPGHGRSPTPGAEPLIQERAQPGGGLADAFQQGHIRQRGHAGPAAALRWSRATNHSRRTPGSSAGKPRQTQSPASGSWPPGSRRHPATRGARTGATMTTAPPGTRVAACGHPRHLRRP